MAKAEKKLKDADRILSNRVKKVTLKVNNMAKAIVAAEKAKSFKS